MLQTWHLPGVVVGGCDWLRVEPRGSRRDLRHFRPCWDVWHGQVSGHFTVSRVLRTSTKRRRKTPVFALLLCDPGCYAQIYQNV